SVGGIFYGGGPFKEGYNVVSGIDEFLPVDVYVPGCPPTPQALLDGLITLQKRSMASRYEPHAGTTRGRFLQRPYRCSVPIWWIPDSWMKFAELQNIPKNLNARI